MSEAPSPLATPVAWNLVTPGYVSEIIPQFEPFAADALRLAGVTPGHTVVDVACGPGTLSLLAAKLGAQVSALDFAANMIVALRERAARAGETCITAVEGDGMALPYGDASFDAGFSMFGLIFFPDRGRGFAELARVLRPGGRAVVASWQPMDRVPVMSELFEAMRAALPGMPFGQNKAPLGEPEEMRDEMLAGGFSEVTVHEVAHTTHMPSLDAWWESMRKSMAPLVLLRAKLGDEAFEVMANDIVSRMRPSFGDGPIEATLRANFGVGVR